MKLLLLASTIFVLFSQIELVAKQESSRDDRTLKISDDLLPLIDLLKKKGFNVNFETPPIQNVYGLFNPKNKTLWISPMSFYQGIGRQTILHEATHAAQSCPNGLLKPMNLELPISPFLNNEIQRILLNNYESNQYLIEKEAYSLQSQKNSVDILLKALNERCK